MKVAEVIRPQAADFHKDGTKLDKLCSTWTSCAALSELQVQERWPRSLGGSTNIAGAEKQRPSSVLYRKNNLLVKEEERNRILVTDNIVL